MDGNEWMGTSMSKCFGGGAAYHDGGTTAMVKCSSLLLHFSGEDRQSRAWAEQIVLLSTKRKMSSSSSIKALASDTQVTHAVTQLNSIPRDNAAPPLPLFSSISVGCRLVAKFQLQVQQLSASSQLCCHINELSAAAIIQSASIHFVFR